MREHEGVMVAGVNKKKKKKKNFNRERREKRPAGSTASVGENASTSMLYVLMTVGDPWKFGVIWMKCSIAFGEPNPGCQR